MGAASVALIDNPLRFQWQYYDEETGLHYNRFRYYSPRLGRYWSVDPIGLVAGHNLYSYVGNDPVNRTDPLGLWWEAALSVVAGVAVAALIVATAPVSLPMLAVAALSGAVVALGVHDGITQYQNTGHICVQCIIEGALTTVVIGAAIAVVAAVAAPEVAAVVVGVAIAAGIESLADTLINWDNLNHDDRMRATGGVIGGVIFGAAARAYQGLRGLVKGSKAPVEEPAGGKTGEGEGKGVGEEQPAGELSPAEASRRHALGDDPATGKYRPNEEATAVRVEEQEGTQLERYQPEGPGDKGDWVDPKTGKVYDGCSPAKSEHFEKGFGKYPDAMQDHLNNPNVDRVVVDTTDLNLTPAQQTQLTNYLDSLPPEQQAKVVRIGF